MERDKLSTDWFQHFFNESDFCGLLSILKEEENEQKIYDDGLNIVSALCTSLKQKEGILKESSNHHACSEILDILVDKGNPKEILLGLLEGADSFKEEEFFQLLLIPIQKVLMRIPGKRGKSLEWVLSVLGAHISTLPPPENQNYEREELLLLDLDPNVQKTSDSLSCYVKFLAPFIEEVSMESFEKKTAYSDRIIYQREILQNYLLQVFDQPLVYHDLHFRCNRQRSTIQHCCLKLLKYLSQTTRNFFKLISHSPSSYSLANSDFHNRITEDSICGKSCVTNLSCANLAYLIFAEQLCPEYFPHVYSYSYLFENYLYLILSLLEHEENLVLFKGLHLCKAILDHVPDLALPGQYFNNDKYASFSSALLKVAIYCPVSSYRTLSITLFKTLTEKLSWPTRYSHLMHVMCSHDHSGVLGFVIDLYRNYLIDSMNMTGNTFFSGRKLHAFARNALHLEDGVQTNILENYDKIVSGLNFLRFLILRDRKEENISGIWDIMDMLSSTYLEPLHKGIELTRAHYQLEAKNVKRSRLLKKDINATVTVNGELLPNVPPNCKSEFFEKSLVTLDLIESILSRIKELLDK